MCLPRGCRLMLADAWTSTVSHPTSWLQLEREAASRLGEGGWPGSVRECAPMNGLLLPHSHSLCHPMKTGLGKLHLLCSPLTMALKILASRVLSGQLCVHCFYWQSLQQRHDRKADYKHSLRRQFDPRDYFTTVFLITRRLEAFSVASFCLLLASSVLPLQCEAVVSQRNIVRNNISTLLDNLLLDYDSRLRPGHGGRSNL